VTPAEYRKPAEKVRSAGGQSSAPIYTQALFASSLKRSLDAAPRCPRTAGDAATNVFEAGADRLTPAIVFAGASTGKRIPHTKANATKAVTQLVSAGPKGVTGAVVCIGDASTGLAFRLRWSATDEKHASQRYDYCAPHGGEMQSNTAPPSTPGKPDR
jgi:hypothetical protein